MAACQIDLHRSRSCFYRHLIKLAQEIRLRVVVHAAKWEEYHGAMLLESGKRCVAGTGRYLIVRFRSIVMIWCHFARHQSWELSS